jgi:hypothetical protein
MPPRYCYTPQIYAVNSDPEIPFWLGCNEFCDMTYEDFQAQVLMTPRTVDKEQKRDDVIQKFQKKPSKEYYLKYHK